MSIQIYLWGSLFAYHSDYSVFLLVIEEKGQDVWLQNVCFKLVFWVFLISSDKLPGHLACLGAPCLLRVSCLKLLPQRDILSNLAWAKHWSNVLTFFFFYCCLYGGAELFHTLLCCPVLTVTPDVLLGRGAVMVSIAQCGAAQLFLNAISNLISLTTVPEILPVICICWFQLQSISGIDFIFAVIFSCLNFFCFLSVLSAMVSPVHLYPPIHSQ